MNISKEEYETLVSTKMLLIQANETIQEQRRIIDRLLTVEETPRGKWYYNFQNGWHCSICHNCVKDMPNVMLNYCPNCGADMRGNNNANG